MRSLVGVVVWRQQLQVDRVVYRRGRPADCCEQRSAPYVIQLEFVIAITAWDGAAFAVPFDDFQPERLSLGRIRTPRCVLEAKPPSADGALVEG